MQEILSEFLSAMAERGLSPHNSSDIKPDDEPRDYRLSTDPASKKKGYYRLKIEDNFGIGYFGDWRNADYVSWHSSAKRTFTDEERRAYAEKLAIEKERQEKERKENNLRVANETADLLLFIDDCKSHPYLEDKGVLVYGELKVSGNELIIPIGDDERVWFTKIHKTNLKRIYTSIKKVS